MFLVLDPKTHIIRTFPILTLLGMPIHYPSKATFPRSRCWLFLALADPALGHSVLGVFSGLLVPTMCHLKRTFVDMPGRGVQQCWYDKTQAELWAKSLWMGDRLWEKSAPHSLIIWTLVSQICHLMVNGYRVPVFARRKRLGDTLHNNVNTL